MLRRKVWKQQTHWVFLILNKPSKVWEKLNKTITVCLSLVMTNQKYILTLSSTLHWKSKHAAADCWMSFVYGCLKVKYKISKFSINRTKCKSLLYANFNPFWKYLSFQLSDFEQIEPIKSRYFKTGRILHLFAPRNGLKAAG